MASVSASYWENIPEVVQEAFRKRKGEKIAKLVFGSKEGGLGRSVIQKKHIVAVAEMLREIWQDREEERNVSSSALYLLQQLPKIIAYPIDDDILEKIYRLQSITFGSPEKKILKREADEQIDTSATKKKRTSSQREEKIKATKTVQEEFPFEIDLAVKEFYRHADYFVTLGDATYDVLEDVQKELPTFRHLSRNQKDQVLHKIVQDVSQKYARIEEIVGKQDSRIFASLTLAKAEWFIRSWQIEEENFLMPIIMARKPSYLVLETSRQYLDELTMGCSSTDGLKIRQTLCNMLQKLIESAYAVQYEYVQGPHFRSGHHSYQTVRVNMTQVSPSVMNFFEKHAQNPLISFFSEAYSQGAVFQTVKTLAPYKGASPNKAALEGIAKRYEEKYGIQICVASFQELHSKLEVFATNVKEPRVVGFIVADKILIDMGHVTPLAIKFSPNSSPEIIMMDILGEEGSHEKVFEALPEQFRQVPIKKTTMIRQADSFSCRIGAITLLRNALIDFQGRDGLEEYWKKVFSEASTALPPEWTYVEQIQRSSQDMAKEALAIRDLFSSKEEKRIEGRSALRHIQETQEKVMEEYVLGCPVEFLQKTFLKAGEHLQDYIPPENVTFYITGGFAKIVFYKEREKPINTYLARKALKEKTRLDSLKIR